MDKSSPDVSVIIVTYQSQDHIRGCVESVFRQNGVSKEVIVVDNASCDGTLSSLENLDCRVIASTVNLGFGRGCNLGYEASSGRFILLLNPDATLESHEALLQLIKAMDAHPRWGIAGARVFSEEGGEIPPSMVYPGERLARCDFYPLPGDIAWVIGASMFIRREVYEGLQGFDPDYFLYSEEIDLCLRARKRGWEIGFLPNVSVKHAGGASVSELDQARVATLKLKGLLLFMQKHFSKEDCIRLAKKEILRSRFRMCWNFLASRLVPNPSRLRNKAAMYEAIWKTNREFLSGLLKTE
jgi:hypothetical protein